MFGGVSEKLGSLKSSLRAMRSVRLIEQQNEFLLNEVKHINEQLRYQSLGESALLKTDASRTRASFDHQWDQMAAGASLPSDPAFMAGVQSQICEMTGLTANWFPGKHVTDIGCGVGRFTYGLLSLGARVTACDQSEWALKRTAELCQMYSERLTTRQVDLLHWDEQADFDLAFSYGVVHHTGNTFLAIRNVCAKVGSGGRVFLMVYGVPDDEAGFREVNSYESLRTELQFESFARRRELLIERYGPDAAHGWFDAISPRVNDLLTFGEIGELLLRLGFNNPRLTLANRNHHVVADLD